MKLQLYMFYSYTTPIIIIMMTIMSRDIYTKREQYKQQRDRTLFGVVWHIASRHINVIYFWIISSEYNANTTKIHPSEKGGIHFSSIFYRIYVTTWNWLLAKIPNKETIYTIQRLNDCHSITHTFSFLSFFFIFHPFVYGYSGLVRKLKPSKSAVALLHNPNTQKMMDAILMARIYQIHIN